MCGKCIHSSVWKCWKHSYFSWLIFRRIKWSLKWFNGQQTFLVTSLAALHVTFLWTWIFCRAFMDWCRFFYHVKQAIAQPFTLCSVFISCKCDETPPVVFKLPSNFFLLQAIGVMSPTTCRGDGTFNKKLPFWSYKSDKPYSNWSQSDRSLLGEV